jgi:hypothetical protein
MQAPETSGGLAQALDQRRTGRYAAAAGLYLLVRSTRGEVLAVGRSSHSYGEFCHDFRLFRRR